MDSHIHIVEKIEYHYLPTCPCEACRQERIRREDEPHSVKIISPDAAEVLFGIPRHPQGSVARELSEAANSKQTKETLDV